MSRALAMTLLQGESCKLSRRVFVRTAGGLLLGTTLGPFMGCGVESAPAIDAATGTVENLPFLTPIEDFFQQFGGRSTVDNWQMPKLRGDSFRLRIDGLVGAALELSLADLKADKENHVTVVKTMMCVLGFRSTAIWTGVPLRLLLDRAGINRSRAVRVRLFGADGFENNLRIADIDQSPANIVEPLIAFQIYDQPLPPELGFPFRLLLADRYGYKNTKWLERIEVTDQDQPTGQYQEHGYSDAGIIVPVVTVENHPVATKVAAGRVELVGIALSGAFGIDAVELALDGGEYQRATLSPLKDHLRAYPELASTQQLADSARYQWPFSGVWVLWQYDVLLTAGEHALDVRVRDQAGQIGDATTLRLTAVV